MPTTELMEAFCLSLLSSGVLLNPQSTGYDAGARGMDSSSQVLKTLSLELAWEVPQDPEYSSWIVFGTTHRKSKRDRDIMHLPIWIFSDGIFDRIILDLSFRHIILSYFFIYLVCMASCVSVFSFSKRHTGLKSVPQNMPFPLLSWAVSCVP